MLLLLAALLLFAGASARADDAADESDPRFAALDDAWWAVTAMIGKGEPWEDCATRLEAALAPADGAPNAGPCRVLLDSIDQTIAAIGTNALAEERPVLDETSSIAELIAALPETQLPYSYLLNPLQTYGGGERLAWAVYAEVRSAGPNAAAGALYRRGREAIPELLTALTDQRATRCVAADRERAREPLVYRVGDVALGLIEAISCCRFHLGPSAYNPRTTTMPLVSQWPPDKRQKQYELVRGWWDATRNLTPAEAALRRLVDVSSDDQIDMLDALIVSGARDEVVRFLQPRYRKDGKVDRELARRLLLAGSRAPLEDIREFTASGNAPDRDMISLLVDFGDIDDFKILRDAIRRPQAGQPPIDSTIVVSQLNYCDNPLAVPVLIALLEVQSEALTTDVENRRQFPAGAIPGNIQRAAEIIQQLTGIDFGFDGQTPRTDAVRGLDDILRWWRREGQAAYDFEQVRPHAPGGIR